MAWNELPTKRNQRSRTYQDTENPLKRIWNGTLATLHYESELDSGICDTELDLTPQRVNNPQFDGWRTTQAGWHYALGKDLANHGGEDGWIGFGGRQGQHWFKFRLARVGYLHWPTRDWDDIGGPPNYDRANLSQEIHTSTIGPNDDPINVESVINWANIWTTPESGELSIQWRGSGDRLKEDIILNQAGREWIADNRPPATPLDETWFGFAFQLDWSDIPQVIRDGVLQDIDGDFADDGKSIELRDALDRLLALMPLSDVMVITDEENWEVERNALRKRFWQAPDGTYYLLVGVRCDMLNQMAAGDLVFDPTITPQPGASEDDASQSVTTTVVNLTNPELFGQPGSNQHCGIRFPGVSGLAGATIDTGLTFITFMPRSNDTGGFTGDWYAEDAAAPPQFAAINNNITDRARTTATCEGDGSDFGDWADNTPVTFTGDGVNAIGDIIQELADNYDPSAIVLLWIYASGTGERIADSWDNSAADCPELTIEYTTAVTRIPRRPAAYNQLAIY